MTTVRTMNVGTARSGMRWPDGKQFAFTIFDDTDLSTRENAAPVYEFIDRLGFKTTKSVWPVRGTQPVRIGGATCENREYREWVQELQEQGFEIGYHNATYHESNREECRAAMEKFCAYFGHYPVTHANHYNCADGLYWGPDRFTGINRFAYDLLTTGTRDNLFEGHIESSPYFWGDLCREHIRYVRDFVFPDINTLKQCPYMPYHDSRRPYVNRWFASADGANIDLFVKVISEKNQDRLEREGGACIMYTHFAHGFYRGGAIDPRFKALMERMSRKNGWFVPVHTLLDHIASERGVCEITEDERIGLERKFLWTRALHRLSQ